MRRPIQRSPSTHITYVGSRARILKFRLEDKIRLIFFVEQMSKSTSQKLVANTVFLAPTTFVFRAMLFQVSYLWTQFTFQNFLSHALSSLPFRVKLCRLLPNWCSFRSVWLTSSMSIIARSPSLTEQPSGLSMRQSSVDVRFMSVPDDARDKTYSSLNIPNMFLLLVFISSPRWIIYQIIISYPLFFLTNLLCFCLPSFEGVFSRILRTHRIKTPKVMSKFFSATLRCFFLSPSFIIS